MFQLLITHQIKPGRMDDVLQWCKEADAARLKENPDYVPPKRYVTVFGNKAMMYIEADHDAETVSNWFAGPPPKTPGGKGNMQDMVIPGTTEWHLLHKVEP